jgi:dTDP-4-dehydrorhamnose 3,5-epimerase
MISGVLTKELAGHPDERGMFTEIIRKTDAFFSEGFGQLSHSYMVDGVVKAWHIHKTQIDWWYAASGTIKVALYDLRETSSTYRMLSEFVIGDSGQKLVIKIPSGVAHGLKVIQGPANLIYATSSVYNPAEEGRIRYDDPEIGYDWIQGKVITNSNIT